MIKINLATRKQSVGIESKDKGAFGFGGGGVGGFKFSLSSFRGIDTEFLKDPKFRKAILAVIVGAMATFVVEGIKDDELKKQEDLLAKSTAENVIAKGELQKTKGYEAVKLQIDADEKVLRTKLETIQKLISNRTVPPKILLALSNAVPKELWLSEFSVNDKEINLKGFAVDYTQIADFTKALSENEYLAEAKLVESKKAKDPVTGLEIASFELSTKKK